MLGKKGKIFWSDRQGNSAPSGAVFGVRTFSGKAVSGMDPVGLPLPATAKVLKRTFFPEREAWDQGVQKALGLIEHGELQKVVLARSCVLELETAPDPFAIAAALQAKAQGAFVFCAASDTGAFLGASPERLYARTGRNIVSEAMAGTRRRGEDEKGFLASEKDLREISPVQTHLQGVLSPLCTGPVSLSPISIHQTNCVQHLYSTCSGQLKESTTDEDLLMHLHPTPALCGVPKQKALSMISELEPFDRGLYGGVIGWTTPDASEWIVAIRSCLLQGKMATLFSGTGIVKGSDPEKEWDELNQKIKLYDGIFCNH